VGRVAGSGNVGYATLGIIPSALGFGAALSKSIAPEMALAGAAGGASLLGAIKKALPVAAVVAAVGGLAAIGNTFHDLTSTIRVGTGETGAALDGLVASAKKVGQGTAASFEDVGTTVTGLNVRLGLTGPVLETLSKQFLAAGRITKQSLDMSTITASMSVFNIKGADTTTALDTLFRVSQATGVGINELASAVQKGAPVLQQFGLSFSDSAALMGTLDKAGIANSTTLAALKIGLVNFAKAGKDPQAALKGTIAQIEGFTKAGKDAEALKLAASIFGTRGASQFVAAVKSGKLNMDDLMKAAGAGSDTILEAADAVSGLSGKWSRFINNVLVIAEPIATRVFDAMNSGLKFMIDTGLPGLQTFGSAISDKISPALSAVESFIRTAVIPSIQLFIGTITGKGADVSIPWMNTIIDMGAAVRNTIDTISGAVKGFVQGFRDGEGPGGAFRDILAGIYTDGIKPIGDKVAAAGTAIQSFVQGFKDGTGPGGTFKDILKQVYEQGIKPLWAIITDNLVPALKSFETWILGPGGTALGSFLKSCMELAVPIAALAAGVLKLVGPMLDRLAPVLNVVAWILTNVVVPAFAAFADETLAVCGYVVQGAKWIGDGFAMMWFVAQPVIKWIGDAFVGMWNNFLQPAVVWIVGGIASVMTWFGNMLVALSNVPTFGWAKDAGDKVLAAAGAVAGFSREIRAIPPTANVAINVKTVYSTVGAPTAGNHVAIPNAAGGTYGPSRGGTIVRVAEAGRSETIVDTETLRAAMAQRNAASDTGSGSPNGPVTFNLYDKDNILIGSMQGVAVDVFGAESAKVARQRGRAGR
jgi:TP901 family phage tail tape measure protein